MTAENRKQKPDRNWKAFLSGQLRPAIDGAKKLHARMKSVPLREKFAQAVAWGRQDKTVSRAKKLGAWALAAAGLFGFAKTVIHLSHPERDSPAVVYAEKDARIYVYPEEKKVIRETGGTYFMADFNRQYACEGLRWEFPRWVVDAENRSYYSMRTCRTPERETDAERKELTEKLEGYLRQAQAKKSGPKPHSP